MTTDRSLDPHVTVIIPTYNRRDSLLRALESLRQQTCPASNFEVVVVDDGSCDETPAIAEMVFPFALRYVYQENQGDAVARNRGAREARGRILQFLDDDIQLESGFVSAIVNEHQDGDKLLVVGNLLPLRSGSPSVYERVTASAEDGHYAQAGEIHFTEVLSGVLSLRRSHYLELGMMQPVARSGSSVWCDVEFAYRAKLQGYAIRRCAIAVAYHDDYAIRDLGVSCARVRRAAYVGAELMDKHPDLRAHIPMFWDKGPIDWRNDGPRLILRKLARQMTASPPSMWAMHRAVLWLEQHAPTSTLLRLLYRWLGSSHIYHGYRQGLRDLGQPGTSLRMRAS